MLKTYRKDHGLTQGQLAVLVGVAATTLRAWEQRTAVPHYRAWRKLEAALKCEHE